MLWLKNDLRLRWLAPDPTDPTGIAGQTRRTAIFASGVQIHQGASLNFAGNSGLPWTVLAPTSPRAPGTGRLCSAFLGSPPGIAYCYSGRGDRRTGSQTLPLIWPASHRPQPLLPNCARGHVWEAPCRRTAGPVNGHHRPRGSWKSALKIGAQSPLSEQIKVRLHGSNPSWTLGLLASLSVSPSVTWGQKW